MKEVKIMRGLPGSGKSTLAEKILTDYKNKYDFALVEKYSTDDYFVHDGEYQFDGRKLTKAHDWNFSRFKRALENDYDLVIVDNTHIQFWEVARYIETALDFGYEVQLVEPQTEWWFNLEELIKKNTHGVPELAIQKMMERWHTTKQILEDCEEKFKCKVDFQTNTILIDQS